MALALYRRYRPDTFDGIIGQDQVTVPLSRALDEGKLTHAYLFSGPRGCGKTSSARILARCINCEKGPTSHPCGECESCKDLATGGSGSIDVVEIDAASHNGVEDARELRERAVFAPARDRFKIFILDEAHMVTQQGFNALLKIVEEPPEHVMFIFATTEPDKVISTIRSRTHHYPFRLVPPEVMGPYLEQVCDKEHIEPEPGVLKLAMRAGGGSVRDTLSVLDQLMAGANDGEISYDSAVALLGFTPDELIGEAIDAVISKDGQRLYAVVEKVVVGGFEPRRFVEDLLARVRDLLVLTLGGEKAESVLNDDATPEDMSDMHRQSSALGLSTLTAMAETINGTLDNMTGAISPRMRLELLAAKLLAGRENGPAPALAASAPVVQNPGVRSQTAVSSARQANGGSQARGGFIGSSRGASNAWRGTGSPGGTTTAAEPQAPNQNNEAQGSRPSVLEEASGNPAVSTPDQRSGEVSDSKAINIDPSATVEEKWDAVLDLMPENVREYIDHAKVPKVSLATNNEGRSRLSMTFDCALSQHAFALALASDAEHNGQKAANVVLDGVRSVFGPRTMIMPTGVAANGEKVISTKRMQPEELAKVKHDIAIAKVGATGGLGVAGGQGGHDASQPKEQKKPSKEEGGDSDGSTHRAGASQSEQGVDGDSNRSGDSVNQSHAVAPTAHGDGVSHQVDDDDYDPWMHPMPVRRAANREESGGHTGQTQGVQQADVEDRHVSADGSSGSAQGQRKKDVSVPDISDGIDPWAMASTATETDRSLSANAGQLSTDAGSSAGVSASNVGSQSQGVADSGEDDSRQKPAVDASLGNQGNLGSARADAVATTINDEQAVPSASQDESTAQPDRGEVAARFVNVENDSEPEPPEVAPEEDDYSLNDQSLGDAVSVSMEEMSKLFEVKKIETFTADDPKNPKNIKPVNKNQEEERR
ncbi:DNA polymerase-3 subunit gamma/tau [Bifidobacterium commune]|uniref:DNA-directed DNA polymerase n=1 Tax=Bifidobacterium commune TaxID=1505727 RepID=A0A1C4GZ98_9BIFI|nr:DNA polymerase III subunit gamma/tau [Bifidobacterium commune]MBB2955311.1 DNA polymerase-3 subunit gamma/tau [Bifidobacterium commune]SCC77961.1 DNA polymerase-3 subunit gamma/tau [Bifidobacterium commune]